MADRRASTRTEGTRWDLRRRARRRAVRLGRSRHRAHLVDDAGVHQNLTFPVQPDPISGMHCWHQAVRVRRAEPGRSLRRRLGRHRKSREAYVEWLARTRPAAQYSPDGTRRPYWLLRPLKPGRDAYKLPAAPDRP